MAALWAVIPADGWKVGDRAYCLHGSRLTRPTLEAGKVYEVTSAEVTPGTMGAGLTLRGVEVPAPAVGFYSNRFAKLPKGVPALRALEAETRRCWYDAYMASSARLAEIQRLRKEGE